MPSRIDTLLAGCGSWESFRELVGNQKTPKEKGDFFERLTQLYLQSSPIYKSKISNSYSLILFGLFLVGTIGLILFFKRKKVIRINIK